MRRIKQTKERKKISLLKRANYFVLSHHYLILTNHRKIPSLKNSGKFANDVNCCATLIISDEENEPP